MKPFARLAVLFLALLALLQVTRVVLGWPVLVAGAEVPMWGSAVAAVVAAVLAAMLWRESRR